MKRLFKAFVLNTSIGTKILFYYLAVFIITTIASVLLYHQVMVGIVNREVGQVSIQTLQSVGDNINALIDNIEKYSQIFMFGNDVQNALRDPTDKYNNDTRINNTITEQLSENPLISSVYIYGNNGDEFAAYDDREKELGITGISDAGWYRKVQELKGEYVVSVNAGNIYSEKGNKGNYISVIREIRNPDTISPLGVIVVNISQDAFQNTYDDIVNNYNTKIAILDEKNQVIVNTASGMNFDLAGFAQKSQDKQNYWMTQEIGGVEYMVSYFKINDDGWKIISVTPFKELSKGNDTFRLITVLVLILNCFLVSLGAVFISRLIVVPIRRLLLSMKSVSKGEFKSVEQMVAGDEIGQLQDGYNAMIDHVKRLIDEILEEQKRKRQMELEVLQAQIKPHFLYNTFDSISSLALAGKSAEVYKLMNALGNYYRMSLSNGKEVISIGDELDVVKNYLKILKYRYEDMFTVEYIIDNRVSGYQILKLILQPFVENAIYHGIRPKEAPGKITVAATLEEHAVMLEVADDGVGMTREELDRLLDTRPSDEKKSFGIRGTIERLRMFYGKENIVLIESQVGKGTHVTVHIPIE